MQLSRKPSKCVVLRCYIKKARSEGTKISSRRRKIALLSRSIRLMAKAESAWSQSVDFVKACGNSDLTFLKIDFAAFEAEWKRHTHTKLSGKDREREREGEGAAGAVPPSTGQLEAFALGADRRRLFHTSLSPPSRYGSTLPVSFAVVSSVQPSRPAPLEYRSILSYRNT